MTKSEALRYRGAIDPAELNRQYSETDEPIEGDPESREVLNE